MEKRTCFYCGGNTISSNIPVAPNAEASSVGLSYKTKFLIVGTESLYADICEDCGTVVRLYVKKTGRNWYSR
ncbi:MAG: hypothetical protein ABFD12_11650 [Syntrophorhabdus sp.]